MSAGSFFTLLTESTMFGNEVKITRGATMSCSLLGTFAPLISLQPWELWVNKLCFPCGLPLPLTSILAGQQTRRDHNSELVDRKCDTHVDWIFVFVFCQEGTHSMVRLHLVHIQAPALNMKKGHAHQFFVHCINIKSNFHILLI